MNVIATKIVDLLILQPRVFEDERGFFYESFNDKVFRQATGVDAVFVQDNHSRSVKGVLRGLHYQRPPMAQAKLVRCTYGEVYDVAVDLRRGSSTFGHWTGVVLSAENKKQLWIPTGFAHGFYAVSEMAELQYKTTAYYSPQHDHSIYWNDPDIGIEWPDDNPLLSAKDACAPSFSSAALFP